MRGKEGAPKPEKTIDIFKKFYYVVLFSLIGYLIYYFVFNKFIVRGFGYVEFDVVKIYSPINGKVMDLNISPKVKKGQLLCTIEERIKNNLPVLSSKKVIINEKITQQEIKLISLKAKYKILKKESQILKSKLNKFSSYEILELYNPNEINKINNLKNQLQQLELQLDLLKTEINSYKSLPKPKVIIKPVPKIPLYSYIKHYIHSPVNGILVEYIKLNNGIVKMKDILFKIQTNKNLRIIGYFSQKNIDYLHKNNEVRLYLPDGRKEKGFIEKIEVNNFDMGLDSLQKLKVTIIPQNKSLKFWNKYRFLNIKIRKYKWQL